MNSKILATALNDVDDSYLEDTRIALGYTIEQKNKGHKSVWRTVLLVAVISVLLCATAYATDWFGLRSYLIQETDHQEKVLDDRQTVDTTNLSLAGTVDSPEYKASEEWITWREQYEAAQPSDWSDNQWCPDDPLIQKYAQFYRCYNNEMLSKLLEISKKYGLNLHTDMAVTLDKLDFYSAAGTEHFTLGNDNCENDPKWGYVYEDGSFKLEGNSTFCTDGMYCLLKNMSGTLPPMESTVWNQASYSESLYSTKSGAEVVIATSDTESTAFIFYQQDNVFLQLIAKVEGITAAKALADTFDFSAACSGEPQLPEKAYATENTGTVYEIKPKDGLFTFSDYLQTPEYLAGSAFLKAFVDWNDLQHEGHPGYVNGQYSTYYYAPFPTGVSDLDDLLTEIQGKYGLKMPTDAKFLMGDKWINAKYALSPVSYNYNSVVDTWEEVSPGYAVEEDYWTLMGTDNFLLDPESFLFSMAKWDNDVWQTSIRYGNGQFDLTYIPKGCFCPVLRETLHPDAVGWAYDTACGEQVYICMDGEMEYPQFPSPVVLYETDSAYVVLSVYGNMDAARMQMYADIIDFTKLG